MGAGVVMSEPRTLLDDLLEEIDAVTCQRCGGYGACSDDPEVKGSLIECDECEGQGYLPNNNGGAS